MKKILTALTVCLMLALCISASAAEIDLSIDNMNNYTAESSVSMKITTADEIASLMEPFSDDEMAIVNYPLFLSSLMSMDCDMVIKSDISDDYSKIKLSMEADYDYDVDLNDNLGIGIDAKMGMWMDMDLSDLNNAKCDIVMLTPMSQKYMYCDLLDFLPADESRLMALLILKTFLNEEFVDSLNEAVMASYEENAEITVNGDVTTIKLDNDAFMKLCDDLVAVITDKIALFVPGFEGMVEIPVLSEMGIEFLGEKGAVMEYNAKENTYKTTIDVCVSMSNLAKVFELGEIDEGSEYDVSLGFEITEDTKYSEIDKTVVTLPEITEENSIDLYKMYVDNLAPEYDEDYYYEEYEEGYPYYWSDVYTDYVPTVENELYVPFRAVLEGAYGDSCDITYSKGTITVTCEYFEDIEKITFNVNDSTVNVDGQILDVGTVLLEGGVTYVTEDFFNIVFGWELVEAYYDMINNEYYISFSTYEF